MDLATSLVFRFQARFKVVGVKEQSGATLRYLPAHSSNGNQIELAFAKLRAALRKDAA